MTKSVFVRCTGCIDTQPLGYKIYPYLPVANQTSCLHLGRFLLHDLSIVCIDDFFLVLSIQETFANGRSAINNQSINHSFYLGFLSEDNLTT